ncbi:MAG: peptidoglycan DD-metalloendopeptidase family protein [Candidatus Paceibacterota bacterium]
MKRLQSFSLIIRPLLVIGVFVFALILASYPSPKKLQADTSVSNQSLFLKSKRTNTVSAPLRIVESSILQSNRTPGLVQPQTLGSVSSNEERSEITKYTVEKGDTVSSIADNFDLKTDTILWANDLTVNSTLQPGDELIILPLDGVLYSVRSGDTISGIAQAYDTKASKIVDYNNLESGADIYAGDTLILPNAEKPETVAAAEKIPLGDTSFSYPAQGVITQTTSGVTHKPSMHAVDIANNCGSRIVAVAGGTVKRAGYAGMLGNRVTIKHPNGVVTLYAHLSQINVVPGQEVHRAQIIGRMGSTGFTIGGPGCHLHYATPRARNPLSSYPLKSTISW